MIAPLSLGVLGGMGPASTVQFLDRLIGKFQGAGAVFNSHFPRIVMCTVPLSDHMSDGAEAATAEHIRTAWEFLALAQVDITVAPCNTAHRYLRCVSVPTPILDIAGAVWRLGGEKLEGRRVLVLGTRQTQLAAIYQNVLSRLNATAITVFEDEQRELDDLILRVNAGKNSTSDSETLARLLSTHRFEVDVALLACTELSLIRILEQSMPVVDTLELLAEASFRVTSRTNTLAQYALA